MIRFLAAFVLGSVATIVVTSVFPIDEVNRDYGFREDIDDLLDNVGDLLSLT